MPLKLCLLFVFLFVLSCSTTQKTPEQKSQPINKTKSQAAAPSSPKIAANFKQLTYPQFKYTPPHPKDYRVKLDSGVVAYLVRDTSLALVDFHFMFASENLAEKPPQVPELSLYSSLLVSGGTKQLTPEQIEDSLEFIAAGLNAYLQDHTSEAGVDALKKDAYALLDLLKQVILEPGFDKEAFDLQKKKYLEGIQHRYDKPQGVMHPAYEYVMYGSHPFNWLATGQEANAVARKQMFKLAGRGFDLSRLVIAVSGDFEKENMIDSLNSFIASFRTKAKDQPKVPPYPGPKPPGIYVIDKDFSQATVQVGFPGLKRPHPDYYPLSVANYIFGSGGFTSRLSAKVRTEEGLAYVVRSFAQSDYYRKATVGFYLQTKAESGGLAIKLCFDELKKMADSGITGAELERAKDGLIQSLPSLFDTPANTAEIFAQSEIWKRDLDHFKKYPEIIRSLTKKQVNDAFRKYFVADSARIVVVGTKDKLLYKESEESIALSDLGKITVLTVSDIEKK